MKRNSPLLYPVRIALHIYRLPKYIERLDLRNRQLENEADMIQRQIRSITDDISSLRDDISILPSIDARLVNLQNRFSKLKDPRASLEAVESVNNTVSDNHEFDYFYKLFEDRFRGSEEAIKERVSEHLPLFKSLPKELQKLPIIDVGCGRGEFLSLLKDSKLRGVGVDMNRSMVERANKLGLEAVQNDAFTYLSGKKTSSLAAVTGFHIVEHIPFEILMKIFEESYRTVAPGGFVLFETPNPQALNVGANTFYLDPSHQRPIPPQLLSFMLESVGFKPETIPLHRLKPTLQHEDKVVVEIYDALYGAGDYAIVARKLS